MRVLLFLLWMSAVSRCYPNDLISRWDRRDLAVTPTLAGEEVAVGEPSVIWDASAGLFKMWYSGGSNDNTRAIYYATSANEMGPWTKRVTPVIGQDNGGVVGQANEGCIFLEDGIYYHFNNDQSAAVIPGGNIRLCTSANGIDFSVVGTMIANDSEQRWCNSRVFKDGATYYMMLERVQNANYRICLASAAAPSGPWTLLNSGNPLATLSYSGSSLSTESSSPGPVIKSGGTFYTFIHLSSVALNFNTHTELFSATSTDLITWSNLRRFLPLRPTDTYDGVALKQLADVSIVEVGGRTLMWNTVVNTSDHSAIQLVTFDGGIAAAASA